MRRMVTDKEIKKLAASLLPSENNKVFCAQFVADELVANNIEPGYYCIRVTSSHYVLNDFYFKIGEPRQFSSTWFDDNVIFNLSLMLDYSQNTKTLTLSLYNNAQEDIYTQPVEYHIDIFKLA